jgi:hypothetical protein
VLGFAFTGDIDICVRPDRENARRVLDALAAFGFRFPNLRAEDFENPNIKNKRAVGRKKDLADVEALGED